MAESAHAQVVETMVTTNQTVLGHSASESQGVTMEAAAYASSLMMINAVSNQYSASQLANASVVTTCAEILKAAAKSL